MDGRICVLLHFPEVKCIASLKSTVNCAIFVNPSLIPSPLFKNNTPFFWLVFNYRWKDKKVKVSDLTCQKGSINNFCQIIRGDKIREGATEIGQFMVWCRIYLNKRYAYPLARIAFFHKNFFFVKSKKNLFFQTEYFRQVSSKKSKTFFKRANIIQQRRTNEGSWIFVTSIVNINDFSFLFYFHSLFVLTMLLFISHAFDRREKKSKNIVKKKSSHLLIKKFVFFNRIFYTRKLVPF